MAVHELAYAMWPRISHRLVNEQQQQQQAKNRTNYAWLTLRSFLFICHIFVRLCVIFRISSVKYLIITCACNANVTHNSISLVLAMHKTLNVSWSSLFCRRCRVTLIAMTVAAQAWTQLTENILINVFARAHTHARWVKCSFAWYLLGCAKIATITNPSNEQSSKKKALPYFYFQSVRVNY